MWKLQHILKLLDRDLLGPYGLLSLKIPSLAIQSNNYVSSVIESQLIVLFQLLVLYCLRGSDLLRANKGSVGNRTPSSIITN